jgi:hypothetical protein
VTPARRIHAARAASRPETGQEPTGPRMAWIGRGLVPEIALPVRHKFPHFAQIRPDWSPATPTNRIPANYTVDWSFSLGWRDDPFGGDNLDVEAA